MKKTVLQITALVALAGAFLLFDLAVYQLFTKRCISDYSDGLKAKSVELDKYLPFDENSLIYDTKADIGLEGDLPVLDGAAALFPVFSAYANALYPEDSVHFDGESFTADSALHYTNTRGAYKAVVDGEADIVICVSPSKEQLAYAKEKGVELEFLPIGREAFVFLVNKNNPVDGLTSDEVRGIYNGRYTNWSQLGGENKPIAHLTRNEGSGSQSALLNFMNGEPVAKDYDAFLGSAIGFSFRFYVEEIVAEGGVKMLALDGAYPSPETIKSGEYPIVSEIYAVTRKGEDNRNVQLMLDWFLSEQGQTIIAESGYIPV